MKRINMSRYRPGVGLMIVNRQKKIFLGRNTALKSHWQMPQGGIESGETPIVTAMREMQEETGTNNGRIIQETKNWYFYDIGQKKIKNTLKSHLQPQPYQTRYAGQVQKWFLIEFLGEDSDINLNFFPHAEFDEWKWEGHENVISQAVSFKKKLYSYVLKEFQTYFFK